MLQQHERHVSKAFQQGSGGHSLTHSHGVRRVASGAPMMDIQAKDDDSRTAEGDYGYPLRGLAYAAGRKMLESRTPLDTS